MFTQSPIPSDGRAWRLTAPSLAVLAVLVLFAWHAAGHAVPVGLAGPQADNLTQHLPKLAFYKTELAAGRVPTWDPLAGTGAADFPIRSHVMYPSTLVTTALLPPWLAALADYAVNFLLMLGLAYALFRRAGPPTAAAAAALAVTLGGLNLRYIFYPYFAQTAAWIPLVFLALDGLFRPGRTMTRVAAAGLALGMMILAGTLNYVLYTGLAGAALVLWKTFRRREGDTPWPLVWTAAVGAVLVGLSIGALRLLPLFEQADRLHGGYGSYGEFKALLLTPASLVASLAPGLFAYRAALTGATVSYGLVTWALAIAFVAFGRKRTVEWFWLAVVGVALATTVQSPLTRLLFSALPGYSGFEPAHIWAVGGLGLAWLAVRALLEAADPAGSKRLLPGAAVLAFSALAILAFAPKQNLGLRHLLPLAAVFALLAAAVVARFTRTDSRQRLALLVAAALALEVFARAGVSCPRLDTRRVYAQTPIIKALRAAGPDQRVLRLGDRWGWLRGDRLYTMEALKTDGIEDLHAYSSMIDPGLRRLLNAHRTDTNYNLTAFDTGAALQPFLTEAPLENGLADNLGARFILAEREISGDENRPLVANHGGLFLYANRDAKPRTIWSPHAQRFTSDDDAAAFVLAHRDWSKAIALTGENLIGGVGAIGTRGTAELVESSPVYKKILVRSDGAGYVLLTELFDKNWQARIDGRPAPIARGNLAFRAVWAPGPEATLEFIYEPLAFYLGAALSLLGMWSVILLLLVGRFRESAHKAAPTVTAR
jgi:hypothetical protein